MLANCVKLMLTTAAQMFSGGQRIGSSSSSSTNTFEQMYLPRVFKAARVRAPATSAAVAARERVVKGMLCVG